MTAKYQIIAQGSFYGGPVTTGTGSASVRHECVWRVEIIRYADLGTFKPWSLVFPNTEPLVIEWEEDTAENCIQGSTAQLTVVSPADRSFLGYVTQDTGAILLKVYKDDALFWRGVLDTSFYEEPYDRGDNYEVTLRFFDLGVLHRLDYTAPDGLEIDTLGLMTVRALEMSGMLTPSEIEAASYKVGDRLKAEYTLMASASVREISDEAEIVSDLDVNDIGCRVDNFYDEEGQPMTMREALEAVMQPLGLKMIQRGGWWRIYTIDTLAKSGDRLPIEWSSTHQTLSSSETYDRVTVQFSPYVRSTAAFYETDLKRDGEPISTTYIGGDITLDEVSGKWEPHRTAFAAQDYSLTDCRNWRQCRYPAPVRIRRLTPVQCDIDEATGIDLLAKFNHAASWTGIDQYETLQDVYQCKPFYLPKLPREVRDRYRLKLSCELFADVRYNPFEDASDGNGGNDYRLWEAAATYLMMPMSLTLRDKNGILKGCYNNSKILRQQNDALFNGRKIKAREIYPNAGGWLRNNENSGWVKCTSATTWGELSKSAYLEWWPSTLDGTKPATDGWTTNRTPIGVWHAPDGADESATRITDGMLVPYPPEGGYVQWTIHNMLLGFPWANNFRALHGVEWSCNAWVDNGIYKMIKWLMLRNPKITIVDTWRSDKEVSIEDIIYEGYIGNGPRAELSINTTVGTVAERNPAAAGQMLTAAGNPVKSITRQGVEDVPEKVLIGALYSQYRRRRLTLSGEAYISCSAVLAYTDRATPGSVFRLTSQSLDCRSLTSEVKMTEMWPEIYTCEDYQEPDKPITRLPEPEDDSLEPLPEVTTTPEMLKPYLDAAAIVKSYINISEDTYA